jgi:PAS domain-containing protein
MESIMKSVADPIVLTDLDNQILLQNRRAEELFSGSANAGEGKRRALKMNDLLFPHIFLVRRFLHQGLSSAT